MKTLLFVLLIVALGSFSTDASPFGMPVGGPLSDQAEGAQHKLTVAEAMELIGAPMGGVVLDAGCCKVCSKGKAGGDSCISRDKTCHKGPGCAC